MGSPGSCKVTVIYQCALEHDIASFDGRDDAEVGERGITLSGGQKVFQILNLLSARDDPVC